MNDKKSEWTVVVMIGAMGFTGVVVPVEPQDEPVKENDASEENVLSLAA